MLITVKQLGLRSNLPEHLTYSMVLLSGLSVKDTGWLWWTDKLRVNGLAIELILLLQGSNTLF